MNEILYKMGLGGGHSSEKGRLMFDKKFDLNASNFAKWSSMKWKMEKATLDFCICV